MKEITIELADVKFYAFHGVYPSERRIGNEFIVNLKVTYKVGFDLTEDKLENTISYSDLFAIVKEEMEKPKDLIETVAATIISHIRSTFPQCEKIECKVTKLHPPIPHFHGEASITLVDITSN